MNDVRPASKIRPILGRAKGALLRIPQTFRWRIRELLSLLLALPVITWRMRAWSYWLFLGHSVRGVVSPLVHLVGLGRLTVGIGTFINTACFFDLTDDVKIGRRVHIAPRVSIYTSSHQVGDASCRAGTLIRAPVEIGDGCWIGANVTILPGVRIAPGTVIAAGGVVTRTLDVPGIYVGIPARLSQRFDDEDAVSQVAYQHTS